jgi:hypothetical protein
MKWPTLLQTVGGEPVFETGLLLAGDVDPKHVRRQLSRWVAAGRLFQLRRGLYALAPPYRLRPPHPFLVANRMSRPSYVSLESALAYHGLIPEHVPITTSVGTGRPDRWQTPLGTFQLRHVSRSWFGGWVDFRLEQGERAALATPEKALLDLVHLTDGGDRLELLASLRLQHLETIDLGRLGALADASGSPKLRRAARVIERLAVEEREDFQPLRGPS